MGAPCNSRPAAMWSCTSCTAHVALGPFRLGGARTREATSLRRPHSPGLAQLKTHRPGRAAKPRPLPNKPGRGQRPAPTPGHMGGMPGCMRSASARGTMVAGHRGRSMGNDRTPPATALAGRARTPARPTRRRRPCAPPTPPNTCRRGSREKCPVGPCQGPPQGGAAGAPRVGDMAANARAG